MSNNTVHRFLINASVLLVAIHIGLAQQSPKAEPKYDVKKCTPKVVKHLPLPKPKAVQTRKGEKPTGYPPVVTLEILESGEIANVKLKRSSGVADLDNYALDSVRSWRYNSRPGCGTIESEVAVNIDFF